MAQRFYNTHCIGMCRSNKLHIVERHHSGEMLLQCTECKTQRPFPPRKKKTVQRQRELFQKNPAARTGEIQRAAALYESFTGRKPTRISNEKLPSPPAVGLVFGELVQIGYRSARDGQLYRHTFRSKKSRPSLIAASDGKSVHIVGGRYAFTDRGIEDR